MRKVTQLGILRYFKSAWLGFSQRGQLRAAALSYYALLSLFPLLVLLLSAANLIWGEAVVLERAELLAQRLFPGDVPSMIISGIGAALNQEQSLNFIALIGLLWAASSFFSNLTMALDTIFGRTDSDRPMWRNRVAGALMIGILALLLAGTVIIAYGLRLFSRSILEYPAAVMRLLSLLIPMLLNTLILTLLLRYVPQARAQWRAIIPGALLGSIGWEISRGLFAWYLENLANYSVVYGSLGAVIALLLWTYISLAILLFSAEFSAAIDHRQHE
ncbi:MAG: YihY/virulence factor BrkB family protein [Anaerolineae bacterium]|nr:YihY/virulence factor BrkB family protein [Anaerolineae bacterium]